MHVSCRFEPPHAENPIAGFCRTETSLRGADMKSDNGVVIKTPEDGEGYWVDGDLYFLKLRGGEVGGHTPSLR